MKRKLSGILALGMALALTIGTTAFAAESPSTDNTNPALVEQAKATETKDAAVEGLADKEVAVVAAPATVAQAEAAATAIADANAKDSTFKVVDGAEQITLDLVLTVDGAATTTSSLVTVRFTNPAFKANTTYLVVHQKADGSFESGVYTSDASAYITAAFHGLSPVAVIEVKTETPAASTSTSSSSSSATTTASPAASPKTGEALPVAGIAMVIALAGIALGAKKVRVSR
jgi:hypothetical protein